MYRCPSVSSPATCPQGPNSHCALQMRRKRNPPGPPADSHHLRGGHCLMSPVILGKEVSLVCSYLLLWFMPLTGLLIKAKICVSFPTSTQKERRKFILFPFLPPCCCKIFERSISQLSFRKHPGPASAGVQQPRPRSGPCVSVMPLLASLLARPPLLTVLLSGIFPRLAKVSHPKRASE